MAYSRQKPSSSPCWIMDLEFLDMLLPSIFLFIGGNGSCFSLHSPPQTEYVPSEHSPPQTPNATADRQRTYAVSARSVSGPSSCRPGRKPRWRLHPNVP